MKVINVTNLLGDGCGTVDTTNTDKYISLLEFEERYRHFAVDLGDIVVASSGNTYGKVGRITEENLPVMMNTSVIRFHSLAREKLNDEYLYAFLRSPDFRNQVHKFVTGGAQPNFGPSHLKKMTVPVPDIGTQQRIGDILSNYDQLMKNNRRRIQLLERTAREIYREWFVRLRFPGHERAKIVEGMPEGWARSKVSDICDTVGGGTPSTKIAEYWGGDVKWVVPTDVTKNDCLVLLDSARKITDKGLRESSAKIVPAEAILMTSRASVGFFALMDCEVCTNQGFISIIPFDKKIRMYLLFNLISRVAEIRSNAKGTTYLEISKGRFRKMDIVVPAKPLVIEFANIASDVVRQVRSLKRSTLRLSQARDLLLPRLMSGEVAV